MFETPKHGQGRFDESGGWTPRFAEEYSVFNATPGNLRGSQGQFPDFAAPPFTPLIGAGHKHTLSTEGIASEIASHVNHFPQNPRVPLPPVEASKQLKSTTAVSTTRGLGSASSVSQGPASDERSAKKARRDSAVVDSQGQTATPPPSAQKSTRKLAPKPDANEMQNEQGFGQPDFLGNPQQPGMGTFVTSPSDMFSYPLSAPASAQSFSGQRSLWDTDMGGMDIDFSVNSNNVFQASASANQAMGPVEWAGTNQFLHGTQVQGDENTRTGKRDGPMTSQPPMQTMETSAAEQALFAASFPTSLDDPFGIANNGGAVNPGLLFSRPPSSNMDLSFQAAQQMNGLSIPPALQDTQTGRRNTDPKAPQRGELRRSASEREIAPRKQDRATASSPIKASGRPGLSRSFSENKGKRPLCRASLPTLAPAAPRPQPQLQPFNTSGGGRPPMPARRPSGRSSPLKGQHQRLPSLSSIPETTGPRVRTQATFSIDASGRARVETKTIIDDDDQSLSTIRKRHNMQPRTRQRWTSSESDSDSSTDDEPIIIPSRNTSFVLPDPLRPTSKHPFHSSQRSVSERSSASYSTFRGSQDDADSDKETVINDVTPTGKPSGDATSELRKLRESRRELLSTAKPRRFASLSGGPGTAGFAASFGGHNVLSPTTLSEASLPTPSTATRSRGVRCICNRTEVPRGSFLAQCESCEMLLHGQCVNLTQQTMPSIYICVFCASTPNMRGGRIRDTDRISGAGGPRIGSLTSPLAHKSFKYR